MSLVCVLAFVDSAHQNLSDGASQAGYFHCFADQSIDKGRMAPVSPCMWKSHRLKRKTSSSIHSEVLGISEGLAAAEFMRCLWLSATDADFNIASPYEHAERCLLVAVTDSKGGFDHLNNPTAGPSRDRRCAVDVAVVRSALRVKNTKLRWVDGARQQLTDSLTKKNGNSDLLRGVLSAGQFAIMEAEEALKMKKEAREERKERSHVHPPRGVSKSGLVPDHQPNDFWTSSLPGLPESGTMPECRPVEPGSDRCRSRENLPLPILVAGQIKDYVDSVDDPTIDDWRRIEPEYQSLLAKARKLGGIQLL